MKNTMRYKDYVATVEVDQDAKLFHGRVLGMRDVLDFHGATVESLEAAFRETVDDYIAWCAEEGETPQKSWQGKMTFRPGDALRTRIATAAAVQGVSINSFMETALDRATREVLIEG
ncbi:type II toxin-antitoxin system HicB family antitoxin [uncultured Enterovirga sp.]|uniref:type II toxin-antitoxin system HicB family antitoxin n=1 Tax=uncultured Enterovirga sp. TaxID=2026352 RepID=UPI0035CA61EB